MRALIDATSDLWFAYALLIHEPATLPPLPSPGPAPRALAAAEETLLCAAPALLTDVDESAEENDELLTTLEVAEELSVAREEELTALTEEDELLVSVTTAW